MRAIIEIDATDIAILSRRWQKVPENFDRIVEPELRQLGHAIAYYMRQEVKEIQYTGALAQSISSQIEIGNKRYSLIVGPTVEHAKYVKYGTRPHWAPIEPLKRWAKWKLGDERLAYAVQHSIAKYGTSVWYERKYGTKENPFPERTLQRKDTQRSIETLVNV